MKPEMVFWNKKEHDNLVYLETEEQIPSNDIFYLIDRDICKKLEVRKVPCKHTMYIFWNQETKNYHTVIFPNKVIFLSNRTEWEKLLATIYYWKHESMN